jgi:hypothetical protein
VWNLGHSTLVTLQKFHELLMRFIFVRLWVSLSTPQHNHSTILKYSKDRFSHLISFCEIDTSNTPTTWRRRGVNMTIQLDTEDLGLSSRIDSIGEPARFRTPTGSI